MAPVEKRPPNRRRRSRRVPKEATPGRLEKAAYHYLQRYATSTENLRRILLRRVERSAHFHGTDRAAGRQWVDAIVRQLAAANLLDDSLYAKMRAETLMRRGYGPRRIASTLAAKGVSPDLTEEALAYLKETVPDPELAAAIAFARRRRIGPFRRQNRDENRQRDLAALARAGISYGVARRIIDADEPFDLTEMADE